MIATMRISLKEFDWESSYNGHDASSVRFLTTDTAKKDFKEFL
ncbi:hypothetical protein VN12_09190 [Pirellula sp. SH-Sr6A]|nr:hypothetical protein VN12_09190 [Pirellula sp. SH-Sr6A]